MEVFVKRDKEDGRWGVVRRESPCEYVMRFESGEIRGAWFDIVHTYQPCGCPVTGRVGFAVGELRHVSTCPIGAYPIRFNGHCFHIIGKEDYAIHQAARVIFLSNGTCVAEGIS